jgi:hypothetical protein
MLSRVDLSVILIGLWWAARAPRPRSESAANGASNVRESELQRAGPRPSPGAVVSVVTVSLNAAATIDYTIGLRCSARISIPSSLPLMRVARLEAGYHRPLGGSVRSTDVSYGTCAATVKENQMLGRRPRPRRGLNQGRIREVRLDAGIFDAVNTGLLAKASMCFTSTRMAESRKSYSIPSFLIRYRSARNDIPSTFAAAVLL